MMAVSVPGMRLGIRLISSGKYWLWVGARLLVGGLFLYAAIDKIIKPYHFAAAVQAYQLLPPVLVAFTAVFLPWIEAVAATAMIVAR